MNFYIRIDGQDGTKSVPLENLLEKGVTKKTYVCLDDGAENWAVAENFRELDVLWQPKIKKKPVKDKPIEDNLNEINETIPLETEEETKIPNKKEESKIEKENDKIEEENVAEKQRQEEERKKTASVAIKRMIVSGLIILLVFFGGKWLFDNESPQMPDEKAKPDTQSTPSTDINIIKILQTELDKEIAEGIHDVSIGNHTDADSKFVEVIKFLKKNTNLNRITVDSLAQKYKDKGDELCISKNLDIAQSYYNHAAILSNTKPQICR